MTLAQPAAVNDKEEGENVYSQGGGVGAAGELLLQAAAMTPAASKSDTRLRRNELPISVSTVQVATISPPLRAPDGCAEAAFAGSAGAGHEDRRENLQRGGEYSARPCVAEA
jgi:hypothetical protein